MTESIWSRKLNKPHTSSPRNLDWKGLERTGKDTQVVHFMDHLEKGTPCRLFLRSGISVERSAPVKGIEGSTRMNVGKGPQFSTFWRYTVWHQRAGKPNIAHWELRVVSTGPTIRRLGGTAKLPWSAPDFGLATSVIKIVFSHLFPCVAELYVEP